MRQVANEAVNGPDADRNGLGDIPMDKISGLPLGYGTEGGMRGAANTETLPCPNPMGVRLDGSDGTDGMGSVDAHARAGNELGRSSHAIGEARGGWYHCMADGCSYKNRNKSHGLRHCANKTSK